MERRSTARGALLCILACASCGGSSESGTTQVVDEIGYVWPGSDAVVEEQRELFADDKITLSEYQGAYFRFEQCANVTSVNVEQTGRDELTGVFRYATQEPLEPPGGDNGTITNDCYQRFFAATEVAFIATDPVVLDGVPAQQMIEFDRADRPCLEFLGIDVPPDLAFESEDYFTLTQRSVDAYESGECSFDLIREPGR